MRFELLKFDERFDRLLKLEDSLVNTALKFNLNLKTSRPGILSKLISLPTTHLVRIEENLEALRSVWLTCEVDHVDPWNDEEFLTLSMRALDLNFPKDFLDNTGNDDLIEGYDLERFQVFRNMRFMETSSYSLLEIQSYPWPELFSRDEAITSELIKYCNDVLWINNCTVELTIPEHEICEIMTEDKSRAAVNFGVITPLFNGPNRPFGILISCKANELAAKQEAFYKFPRA